MPGRTLLRTQHPAKGPTAHAVHEDRGAAPPRWTVQVVLPPQQLVGGALCRAEPSMTRAGRGPVAKPPVMGPAAGAWRGSQTALSKAPTGRCPEPLVGGALCRAEPSRGHSTQQRGPRLSPEAGRWECWPTSCWGPGSPHPAFCLDHLILARDFHYKIIRASWASCFIHICWGASPTPGRQGPRSRDGAWGQKSGLKKPSKVDSLLWMAGMSLPKGDGVLAMAHRWRTCHYYHWR